MKLNFRKIASVITGTVMLGSTVALAAAANYPAPFVQNGKADVAIVYGSSAANSDLVAVTDITANLASTLAKQTATSGTTSSSSVSGGDYYKFEKPSTKFHLGDNFSTISSLVDDDELPTLLADGKFIDDDNDEFDYTQKIEMNSTQLAMFDDNDYKEDAPTVGFRIPSGYNVLNYTITFVDQPLIADLVTADLPFMGKSYYILSNGTSGANLVLTLLDSATDTVITEGETKTVNVGDKAYEVSVNFVSSTEAKLSINGETTNTLNEGETQKLSDGAYVGIKDILYNSKDTGISSVEFSIGSGKLVLTSGSEVQLNDKTISGLKVVMVNSSGTITSATGTLSSIEVDWATDDDTFITEDTEIVMPGFGAIKLGYGGLSVPSSKETFTVEQGSSTYIKLNDFPLKDGNADIPLLYGSASGSDGNFTGIGQDANNKLVTTNTTSLTFDKDTDEQFVITYESTTECESYLAKTVSFGTDSSSRNITTLQIYRDGAWEDERTVKAEDTFSLGNAELGVALVERSPANRVTFTANSSNTKFNILCSNEGLKVWLPFETSGVAANNGVGNTTKGIIYFNATGNANWTSGHDNNVFYLTMQEEDKDGNVAAGDQWNVSLGWDSSSTAEPQVADLIGEDVTLAEIGDTDVFRSFMYSALATEFLYNQPTSQDSLEIIYNGEEVIADVYVLAPSAVVSTGGTTTTGTVAELGSVSVMDSEVSSVSTKNLVVVGGSCVNKVAADLLGGTACGANFEQKTGVGSGSFLIQSFSRSGGKVATLVAGYNAADTSNAAKYLTSQTVDTTVGKKYKGTSSTSATLETTTA